MRRPSLDCPSPSLTLLPHSNVIQASYRAKTERIELTYQQSNAYTSAAYNKAEEIATNVYSRVAPPVQNHLGGPISTADGYANRSLDFVEKRCARNPPYH